jgi:hypothetical protein
MSVGEEVKIRTLPDRVIVRLPGMSALPRSAVDCVWRPKRPDWSSESFFRVRNVVPGDVRSHYVGVILEQEARAGDIQRASLSEPEQSRVSRS